MISLIREQTSAQENDTVRLGCPLAAWAQCMAAQRRCFHRASTCVYDTEVVDAGGQHSVMAACRNGFHLRSQCGIVSPSHALSFVRFRFEYTLLLLFQDELLGINRFKKYA